MSHQITLMGLTNVRAPGSKLPLTDQTVSSSTPQQGRRGRCAQNSVPDAFWPLRVPCHAFRLSNAPGTFQRAMNAIFEPLKHCCAVYMDDILVFSSTLEEHTLHLKQVLEVFRGHRLFAKLSKCEFARREMPFLGFMASAEGLHVDPAKVAAVEQWPTAKNVREVRQFLVLANHLRRFIKDFSVVAYPLNQLLRKDVTFDWTSQCE
jgi:Reverse transcriptase (RNA-dependent DNA polymerase)